MPPKVQEIDLDVFKRNGIKKINEAREYVSRLQQYYFNRNFYDEPPTYYEEEDFATEGLRSALKSMEVMIKFYLEYTGTIKLREQFEKEISEHEKKITHLELFSEDYFYSPLLSIIEEYFLSITSFTEVKEEIELKKRYHIEILERILRGTGKLIADKNIEPKNEKEVRLEVYNTLVHVFPDTVREIPISKVTKTYKPDIGIKSLQAAIEYKFVDNLNEAKNCVGEIFEDVKGYEGSADWVVFYAVIYMTDNFFTSDQIEAEFSLSGVDKKWKPMLVIGKGQRTKKEKSEVKSPTNC